MIEKSRTAGHAQTCMIYPLQLQSDTSWNQVLTYRTGRKVDRRKRLDRVEEILTEMIPVQPNAVCLLVAGDFAHVCP
jgi:hypothetical protein